MLVLLHLATAAFGASTNCSFHSCCARLHFLPCRVMWYMRRQQIEAHKQEQASVAQKATQLEEAVAEASSRVSALKADVQGASNQVRAHSISIVFQLY